MEKQASCKDRIKGELENALAMLSPDCEKCQEGYCDEHRAGQDVLSLERLVVYEIQLSWGGPAESFIVHVVDDTIQDIFYKFADWFDVADVRLVANERDLVERWIFSQLYIEEIM